MSRWIDDRSGLEPMSAADRFYEWLLSDHPAAAAERARRQASYRAGQHEEHQVVGAFVDRTNRDPQAPGWARSLAETMGRVLERSQRRQAEQDAVSSRQRLVRDRERFEISQRTRDDDYRYPARYQGAAAARQPVPPDPGTFRQPSAAKPRQLTDDEPMPQRLVAGLGDQAISTFRRKAAGKDLYRLEASSLPGQWAVQAAMRWFDAQAGTERVPRARARSVAADAVGLFLEYHTRYEYEQDAAQAAAVNECIDGEQARQVIAQAEAADLAEQQAEQAERFSKLNPEFGVVPDSADPRQHRFCQRRERSLALGTRAATAEVADNIGTAADRRDRIALRAERAGRGVVIDLWSAGRAQRGGGER